MHEVNEWVSEWQKENSWDDNECNEVNNEIKLSCKERVSVKSHCMQSETRAANTLCTVEQEKER